MGNKIKSLFFFSLVILGCSNPLSEQDKKAIVKTLISEYCPAGEYVVFWDGTNDKNQRMPAGTYYARFLTQEFTFFIKMTALEGGTGVSNDSSLYIDTYQPITNLEQNDPEPFYIKDGTNIPFKLSYPATVELTVRTKE
jgi:hypothetical protein